MGIAKQIPRRNSNPNRRALLLFLLLPLIMAGCGGGSSGSASTVTATSATGTLSMHLADARPLLPAGTEKVMVTISEISLHKEGGGWVSLPMPASPYSVDLLELSNGISINFVAPVQLAAGKYTQVRIGVTGATITISGANYPVEVPRESMQTDRNVEIVITQDDTMEITLDFDLSRSIVTAAPGTYRLQPVIHIVKTSDAAILEGTLETDLFGEATEAEVTLLAGGEEYSSLIVEKSDPLFRAYWLDPRTEYTLRVEVAGEIMTEKTISAGTMELAGLYRTTLRNSPRVKMGDWGAFTGNIVRFRSFNNTGGKELFIGPNPGISGYPNRVEEDLTWTRPGANNITVTFDPSTDSLSATVNGTALIYSDVALYASAMGCPVENWNAMQVMVINQDAGTTVNFENITLGGYDLGSFSGGTGSAGNVRRWAVTQFDFSQGFSVAGTVRLAGTFSDIQSDLSKIEIYIGCR